MMMRLAALLVAVGLSALSTEVRAVPVLLALREEKEERSPHHAQLLREELLELADTQSTRYAQWHARPETLASKTRAPALSSPQAQELQALANQCWRSVSSAHPQRQQAAARISAAPAGGYARISSLPLAAARALRDKREFAGAKLPDFVESVLFADTQVSDQPRSLWNGKGASTARREAVRSNAPLGTPANQRAAYGIPAGYQPKGLGRNMVWGPGTYGFLKSDVQYYFSTYNVNMSLDDVHREGFAGTPGGDNFGEASLDVDCITGVGTGIPTYVYNSNNSQSTEETLGFGYAFLDFVVELAGRPADKLPTVLSISLGSVSAAGCKMMCDEITKYGITTNQCIQYMATQRQVCMLDSVDQEKRIDAEFAKLGARGVTIVAAAGDGGSHFSFVEFPDDNIGSALNKICCEKNFPTFPASSPSVLGVGGLQWTTGMNTPRAWTSGGSGFSWVFDRPSYQDSAVEPYLMKHQHDAGFPPAGAFAKQGRAYPDVAFLASQVPMVDNGNLVVAGGTSASAPESGGLISLIIDHRLSNGLPPLGFVNPRLYASAHASSADLFYDVTIGNSSCAINGCCSTGFPCTTGWDAMSGFGAPKFPGLLKSLGSRP